jgi:predicted ATPase/tRNA A-37 threonylcarbamoyl transferase component Bud32
MASASQFVGQTISHYRIIEKLGCGGMGVVYKAQDLKLGRWVALKFLPEELTREREALERFQREACAVSALNHPNICTIHEIDEYEHQPFIVMELIEGRTLRTMVGQPICLESVSQLVGQIAKALRVAHAAGIVHRDIKPENIMVREDGLAKLLDFGLARLVPKDAQSLTETIEVTALGRVLGTLRYMAPEQAVGQSVTSAADIFSLGIVLYELATGQHPFAADSSVGVIHSNLSQTPLRPSRLNPEIPSILDGLVLRMLERDPHLRPIGADVDAALAELVGQSTGRPGPAIMQPKRRTVGRENPLGELRAGFESAVAGRGLLLCVSGEPGIGKTTLVEDFVAELTAAGRTCSIARGRCSERLAGTEAYLPFLEALDSLLHGESNTSVARLMKLLAPTWYAQITPQSGDNSSSRMLVDVKTASQERMKRELSALLQEVSLLRPLIIFFDDLQWADLSTIDLLSYLTSKFESMRVLIVAAYRPSEAMLSKHPFLSVKLDLQARSICREIPLEFLSCKDVESYLAIEFPHHRFPANFPAFIHAKTEGNPLFMVDLLRYLRDRGIMVEQQGHWEVVQSPSDMDRKLPQSVRSMIQRKIEQLIDDDRGLLVTASVQGFEFDTAVLARALETDAATVEERLEVLDRVNGFVQLVRQQVFPDGTLTLRYRFVHVLYQNALYASLSPTRRALLSAAVAHALLGHYGEQKALVASDLALLFDVARDFSCACDFFLLAAQNAAKVFANHEAITLAHRGLELLNLLPDTPARARHELALRMTLGVPLMSTKGYADSEVERTFSRARELSQQLGETGYVYPTVSGLWAFYIVKGNMRTALELAQLGLTQREQSAITLVQAHYALGATRFFLGEPTLALEHCDKSIALCDPQLNLSHIATYGRDHRVATRFPMALALWLLGYPEKALRISYEGLSSAREVAHPFSLAVFTFFAAILHQFRREVHKTQQLSEELIELSREHGFSFWKGWGRMLYGWTVAELGEYERGVALMQEGMVAQRALGCELMRPFFLALLAEVLGKAGQATEGLAAISEATAIAQNTGERFYEAELYRLKGELLMQAAGRNIHQTPASGVITETEAFFRQAINIARRQSAKSWELRAVMGLSRLYQQESKKDEARQLMEEIYGSFTEGFDSTDLRDARLLLEELSHLGMTEPPA